MVSLGSFGFYKLNEGISNDETTIKNILKDGIAVPKVFTSSQFNSSKLELDWFFEYNTVVVYNRLLDSVLRLHFDDGESMDIEPEEMVIINDQNDDNDGIDGYVARIGRLPAMSFKISLHKNNLARTHVSSKFISVLPLPGINKLEDGSGETRAFERMVQEIQNINPNWPFKSGKKIETTGEIISEAETRQPLKMAGYISNNRMRLSSLVDRIANNVDNRIVRKQTVSEQCRRPSFKTIIKNAARSPYDKQIDYRLFVDYKTESNKYLKYIIQSSIMVIDGIIQEVDSKISDLIESEQHLSVKIPREKWEEVQLSNITTEKNSWIKKRGDCKGFQNKLEVLIGKNEFIDLDIVTKMPSRFCTISLYSAFYMDVYKKIISNELFKFSKTEIVSADVFWDTAKLFELYSVAKLCQAIQLSGFKINNESALNDVDIDKGCVFEFTMTPKENGLASRYNIKLSYNPEIEELNSFKGSGFYRISKNLSHNTPDITISLESESECVYSAVLDCKCKRPYKIKNDYGLAYSTPHKVSIAQMIHYGSFVTLHNKKLKHVDDLLVIHPGNEDESDSVSYPLLNLNTLVELISSREPKIDSFIVDKIMKSLYQDIENNS